MMDVHSDFWRRIAEETEFEVAPGIAAERFVDDSGNIVRRLSAPAGTVSLRLQGVFRSDGREMRSIPMPKRSPRPTFRKMRCRSSGRADTARPTFSRISPGRTSARSAGGGRGCRRSAISFISASDSSYPEARPTRTASEALAEGVGVCRDFTHLAVALCRCVNIPARYCNGYLGDIGVPPDPAPMDFNAWFEAFLGDRCDRVGRRQEIDADDILPCPAAAPTRSTAIWVQPPGAQPRSTTRRPGVTGESGCRAGQLQAARER